MKKILLVGGTHAGEVHQVPDGNPYLQLSEKQDLPPVMGSPDEPIETTTFKAETYEFHKLQFAGERSITFGAIAPMTCLEATEEIIRGYRESVS